MYPLVMVTPREKMVATVAMTPLLKKDSFISGLASASAKFDRVNSVPRWT